MGSVKRRIYCDCGSRIRVLRSTRPVLGCDVGECFYCEECGVVVGIGETLSGPTARIPRRHHGRQFYRGARIQAHDAFDRLWQAACRDGTLPRRQARRACYDWLATKLRKPPSSCHIARLDPTECARVVHVCQKPGAAAEYLSHAITRAA